MRISNIQKELSEVNEPKIDWYSSIIALGILRSVIRFTVRISYLEIESDFQNLTGFSSHIMMEENVLNRLYVDYSKNIEIECI
jgi:hypothetical protein